MVVASTIHSHVVLVRTDSRSVCWPPSSTYGIAGRQRNSSVIVGTKDTHIALVCQIGLYQVFYWKEELYYVLPSEATVRAWLAALEASRRELDVNHILERTLSPPPGKKVYQ